MNFLNPLLLLGALFAAVPVVIHLLNKSRYKVEPFGAMMFLKASLKVRARSIRLQEILLLIMRILFFLLLALAMARPVIMPKFSTAGNQPVSNVLIIDNSFSMRQGEGDNQVFTKVIKTAQRIISRMSNADNMQIILAGDKTVKLTPGFSYDKKFIRKIISDLKPGYGSADLPQAIEEGVWSLDNSNLPVRRIYILTDRQKTGWTVKKAERWKRLKKHIKALKIPVAVYVYNHEPNREIANIAPVEIFSRSPVIDTYRKTRFVVEFANYSGKPLKTHAEFKVDGNIADERDISLGTGLTSVHFDYLFSRPGSHYVSVTVDKDDLPIDNTLVKAVHVMRQIPVLIIEGISSPNPWKSSAEFAKMTLEASSLPGEEALFNVTDKNQIDMDSFNEEYFEQFKCVILADVTAVPEYFAFTLRKFVESGGGLFIAAGKNTVVSELNRLGRITQLMPAELTGRTKLIKEYFHPDFPAGTGSGILEIFDTKHSKMLSAVKVREFWKAKPLKQSSVIANLKGNPFILFRKCGKGGVILWTTSLNADWTNFPLTPDYLPLLQNLVIHLSSSVKPPVNISPGDRLIYSSLKPITGDKKQVAMKPAVKEIYVTTPDMKKHKLKPESINGENRLEWKDTWRTGLYTVHIKGLPDRYFSVNTIPQESDLSLLGASGRSTTGAKTFMQFVDNDKTLSEAMKLETGIVEWWKYFIIAAILLLCIELYISWRLNG